MLKKNKQYITFSLIFILAIIIAIFTYQKYSALVNKTYPGVIINKETMKVKEMVTTTINGQIEKTENGFYFNGKISIDELDYTHGTEGVLSYYTNIVNDYRFEYGIISYPVNVLINDTITPYFAQINTVYTNSNMDYLILSNFDTTLKEDIISAENGVYITNNDDIIVFPATDEASAISLLKEKKLFFTK